MLLCAYQVMMWPYTNSRSRPSHVECPIRKTNNVMGDCERTRGREKSPQRCSLGLIDWLYTCAKKQEHLSLAAAEEINRPAAQRALCGGTKLIARTTSEKHLSLFPGAALAQTSWTNRSGQAASAYNPLNLPPDLLCPSISPPCKPNTHTSVETKTHFPRHEIEKSIPVFVFVYVQR